jgi:hypothetical protein
MCECQELSGTSGGGRVTLVTADILPFVGVDDLALGLDRTLWLMGRDAQGMGTRIASAATQRPGGDKHCNNKLADMIAHLRTDRAAGFQAGKGAIKRQNDMLTDARGLFKTRHTHKGTESWDGHAKILQVLLDALQTALDAWDGAGCTCEKLHKNNPSGLRDCKLRLAEARIVLRTGVPAQPVNYQAEQEQQIPQWLQDAGGKVVDGILFVPKLVWILFSAAIMIIAAILGLEVRQYA